MQPTDYVQLCGGNGDKLPAFLCQECNQQCLAGATLYFGCYDAVVEQLWAKKGLSRKDVVLRSGQLYTPKPKAKAAAVNRTARQKEKD